MINLSVIIPIYNEERFLKESIERVLETRIFDKIILVNDSSTDNSSLIAKNFADKYTHIIYLETQINQGKGHAVNTGILEVNTSHVVIHDADLEYFPNDIIDMFEVAKQNKDSLILGSRFTGNKERKNIYLRTYFSNKFLSKLFSIINNISITDVATCYKLAPIEFFNKFEFVEKGFAIEIEVLSKFVKYNKSIIEVPINYVARSYEEGKKIKFIDGFRYIKSIIKYKF